MSDVQQQKQQEHHQPTTPPSLRQRRRRFFYGYVVGIALALAASACAAIVGIDDAELGDPGLDGSVGAADGTNADRVGSDGGPNSEASCLGPGCPCTTNPDCKDRRYALCQDGKCVECTTAPAESCPLGSFCLPGASEPPIADAGSGDDAAADATPAPSEAGTGMTTGGNIVNECAPGCSSDDGCKAVSAALPFCAPNRAQCIMCRSKAECPNRDEDCSGSGLCLRKCDAGCGNGTSCCDSQNRCFDLMNDHGNCGGCGLSCTGSEICCGGKCKNPFTDPQNCGKCGTTCATATPSCVVGGCR